MPSDKELQRMQAENAQWIASKDKNKIMLIVCGTAGSLALRSAQWDAENYMAALKM